MWEEEPGNAEAHETKKTMTEEDVRHIYMRRRHMRCDDVMIFPFPDGLGAPPGTSGPKPFEPKPFYPPPSQPPTTT